MSASNLWCENVIKPELSEICNECIGAEFNGLDTYRHEHLLQPKQLVQRPNRHEANRRRAIRIGNQLLPLRRLGIDLGHHQRNSLLVPERGRVVDDHGAVVPGADVLGVGEAEVAVDREEYHVALPGGVLVEELDGHLAELGVDLPSGAAFRAEDAEVAHGEGALFEAADDFLADGTGGAHDADVEGRGHAEGGGGRSVEGRGGG